MLREGLSGRNIKQHLNDTRRTDLQQQRLIYELCSAREATVGIASEEAHGAKDVSQALTTAQSERRAAGYVVCLFVTSRWSAALQVTVKDCQAAH